MPPPIPRLFRPDRTKDWIRDPLSWSPQQLLTGDGSLFSPSLRMSVKRSLTSRFFMYEEHADVKLQDDNGPTQIIQRSPEELAHLLHEQPVGNNQVRERYHYWTSPIADVAPGLLKTLEGYDKIRSDERQVDPRGPSLWMGSSGSATQAHYDVADNVIIQLFGSKRIRCYGPNAASALHVFPDAHPRARKSQVNFDLPDIQPGNAIFIPAFWFHHLENGDLPSNPNSCLQGDTGPSVSLNLFTLSNPMMAAQTIFREASRPFGTMQIHFHFAVAALNALSFKIFEGLGIHYKRTDFIRNQLLDTRYTPLRNKNIQNLRVERTLTVSEHQQIVSACSQSRITGLLPQLASLREGNGEGVLFLVLCHLFELWAVEMLGATSVAGLWEAVLLHE